METVHGFGFWVGVSWEVFCCTIHGRGLFEKHGAEDIKRVATAIPDSRIRRGFA